MGNWPLFDSAGNQRHPLQVDWRGPSIDLRRVEAMLEALCRKLGAPVSQNVDVCSFCSRLRIDHEDGRLACEDFKP